MRTHSRLGLLAGLTLLLTGCGSAPPMFATPDDESRRLVAGALSDLENRPFVHYTGTADFVRGNAGSFDVGVSDSGLVYGTAEVEGAKLSLLSFDERYYIKAEEQFWSEAAGSDATEADKFDGKWTPVDPEDFFHPGAMLATDALTESLKSTLTTAKTADSWRPEETDRDGHRCLPLQVGSGDMCVAADKPNAIVQLKDVRLAGDHDATVTAEVASVDEEQVADWGAKLRAAVKKLKTVYAYGGVSMSTSSDNFDCANTTCTFRARMGLTDVPDHQRVAGKAKVGFHATARTDTGRSESCTASVTVKIGKSKTAKCSVTFKLLPGESASVTGSWESTGLMTFKPDAKKLGAKAAKGVEDVIDRL